MGYVEYVKSETDCTSTDSRYSEGSKVLGSVRYALRMARGCRENGMLSEAARYLRLAAHHRKQMATLKAERASAQQAHDVAAWRKVAEILGLTVEASLASNVEIAIFNGADRDRGFLWVAPLDLNKIEPGDDGVKTINPSEAFAVLGRLARKV